MEIRIRKSTRTWGLKLFIQPRLSAFSEQRKTWSRLPYHPRGIHCLPTGCRRRADTVGCPANITQAPLSRTMVGSPLAAASKGHVIIQCGPMGMAGTSVGRRFLFSFPGVQTHSLVPLTRTVMVPSAAISATVASLVTCSGPERRALVILGSFPLSIMYWPSGVGSLDAVSFRTVSSIVESPDRQTEP